MIYIFDDRIQRRKDNEEKLRCFSDLIKFDIINLIPGKSAEDSIFDSIDNPECIIFHKSYVFEDENVTFETVRQLFTSLGVPVVIFSGGTENSNKGTKEINMNADSMYGNLPYFLANFKETGHINIDTLLWGKRYRLNALLNFQNNVSQKYLINSALDDIVENFEEVERYVRNLSRGISTDFRDAIILDIKKSTPISWQQLADIIDKNVKKFSK